MPVFKSPTGPTMQECLEEARDMLYERRVPFPILENLLTSWVAIGDSELTSEEADGILWGFVAGRVYADSMRLAPEFYMLPPNTQ